MGRSGMRNDLAMLILALVAILAAPSLVGCASGREPLVLTWGGPVEDLAAFEAAVAEWADTCGADVVSGPDGALVLETNEGVPAGSAAMTLAHAIHVRPGKASVPVLAHEIGHALGLGHAPGLMYEGFLDPDAHVTSVECAALDEAHHDR